MLEAERAGAKALVVFMDEHPRSSEAWKLLRGIQNDETHNCALIGELIKRAGAPYSHATGEFYGKAVAIKGKRERIEFLVKGLGWAVRKLEEELPKLDEESRNVFVKMRDSHLRSIAACQALVTRIGRDDKES